MSETIAALPPRLAEIVEDFKLCEGKDKLELLLEYSGRMPPLPDWLAKNRAQLEQVHECMTPVFVQGELKDGGMAYYFDVPEESPTVRGFAALLSEGVGGSTPQQIIAIPGDFYYAMGLPAVLSGQRLNGLRAILAYIRSIARRELTRNQA